MTDDQIAAPVGIVAAMPVEARALGVGGPCNEIVKADDNTLLYVCGVGPDNARRATRALLAAGAVGVVSWGTAGGLAADFNPGTPLLAASVVSTSSVYDTDSDWVSRLGERLGATLPINLQPIYSDGLMINGVADKMRLADETGAVAVDMESGMIAETASAAGVPFVCIRVVADPVSFSLPQSFGNSLDEHGLVSIPRVLRGIARRPGDIIPMLQVALHVHRAIQVLSLISRIAGPRLLGP